MGGANLEVFKFGFYLFFPIAVMAHFSDPQWYNEHVAPYRAAFWPTPDQIVRPPTSKTDIQAELDRIKTSRSLARQATVSSSTAELEAGRAAVEEEREKTMEDKRGLTPREWRRSQGLEDGVLTQGGVLGKWV